MRVISVPSGYSVFRNSGIPGLCNVRFRPGLGKPKPFLRRSKASDDLVWEPPPQATFESGSPRLLDLRRCLERRGRIGSADLPRIFPGAVPSSCWPAPARDKQSGSGRQPSHSVGGGTSCANNATGTAGSSSCRPTPFDSPADSATGCGTARSVTRVMFSIAPWPPRLDSRNGF